MGNKKHWLEKQPSNLFSICNVGKKFLCKQTKNHTLQKKGYFDQFLVMKQIIDLNRDKVYILGSDFHGDIQSVNTGIVALFREGIMNNKNPFKIKDPHAKIIILGDMTNRGLYSAEVLYTIFRLKIANPKQVIILRGNHETRGLLGFGVVKELRKKFKFTYNKKKVSIFDNLIKIFNLFPCALYLGIKDKKAKKIDYTILCHAGIDITFNPHSLLTSEKKCAYTMYKKDYQWLNNTPVQKALTQYSPNHITFKSIQHAPTPGFIGSDFNTEKSTSGSFEVVNSGRGPLSFSFGEYITRLFLKQCSTQNYTLRGYIGGHQHTGKMLKSLLTNHGICLVWRNKQWNGKNNTPLTPGKDTLVVKLNKSPDSAIGSYIQDMTYLVLQKRKKGKYKTWNDVRLQPKKANVFFFKN